MIPNEEMVMRIRDEKTDRTLTSIMIMLTPAEAHELASKLHGLDPETGDHIHVSDGGFKREITIAIYTPDNLHYFNEKTRELLEE
jgi:hypothetical protein